jgi:hypothetical protein
MRAFGVDASGRDTRSQRSDLRRDGVRELVSQFKLVAGGGFEPPTFRL